MLCRLVVHSQCLNAFSVIFDISKEKYTVDEKVKINKTHPNSNTEKDIVIIILYKFVDQ